MRLIDLTGRRFGKLTVVERLPGIMGKSPIWRCTCTCGGERITNGRSLATHHSTSCGCGRSDPRSHGMSGTLTYVSWLNMRDRCGNSNHKEFRYWGGRGIRVCDRWADFANFLADMGLRPEGTSIDRFPNSDGHYEPGNCRWATDEEQTRNYSRNVVIERDGVSRCVIDWAPIVGIKPKTIYARLKKGWDPIAAITVPTIGKDLRWQGHP